MSSAKFISRIKIPKSEILKNSFKHCCWLSFPSTNSQLWLKFKEGVIFSFVGGFSAICRFVCGPINVCLASYRGFFVLASTNYTACVWFALNDQRCNADISSSFICNCDVHLILHLVIPLTSGITNFKFCRLHHKATVMTVLLSRRADNCFSWLHLCGFSCKSHVWIDYKCDNYTSFFFDVVDYFTWASYHSLILCSWYSVAIIGPLDSDQT